jgi:serine/threonine-protein kinase
MAESVAPVLGECPDEQTVLDLLAGRLSGAALAQVERHLGECAACTDLLAGATPLLAQVRSAPTLSGAPVTDDGDDGPARLRPPSLDPGTVLRDTYEIVRRTGKGGMGEVYEARHARLKGRYAVKVLPPEFAENAAALSRFRREAQIASGLQHPNIVQVIDFHETADGRPYLVMEYLDGEDLAEVMARHGRFSLDEALPIVEQIAAALGAVHRAGIVHRDVKPHNVLMVAHDGKQLVKLVDFGLSKGDALSPVVTRQPMLLGTPQYMAPEQALGHLDAIGPATDQFALGALVYEMLAGRPAFVGAGISSVLYQIVHEEPPPIDAAADRRAEPAVRRALSKKIEDRFPTLSDFTAALAEAAAAPVVRDAPGSPAAAPTVKRRRRAAWAAAAVLASVAGLAVATRAWRAQTPAAPPSAAPPAAASAPARVTLPDPIPEPAPPAVGADVPVVLTPAPAPTPPASKAHAKPARRPLTPTLSPPGGEREKETATPAEAVPPEKAPPTVPRLIEKL